MVRLSQSSSLSYNPSHCICRIGRTGNGVKKGISPALVAELMRYMVNTNCAIGKVLLQRDGRYNGWSLNKWEELVVPVCTVHVGRLDVMDRPVLVDSSGASRAARQASSPAIAVRMTSLPWRSAGMSATGTAMPMSRTGLPSGKHRHHRLLNNRAENSYQPTRQREHTMRGLKSAGHAQRFLSAFGPVRDHLYPRRHRFRA